MNKALIIIDFVNDFVLDDGALTCGLPAQKIDDYIALKISEFANCQFIIVANDKHQIGDVNHPEYKLFPPHCIDKTNGREVYGNTQKALKKVENKLIYLDKTRYSAFSGTNLDQLLRERKINSIYLVGVCTDICILHTAIDAYNLGYEINIYQNGVASFNEEAHFMALAHFKNSLGANIIEEY